MASEGSTAAAGARPGRGLSRREAGSFRGQLVARAGLRDGQRVLDLGCGRGRLAMYAKRWCPGAEVVGIDIDPGAVGRARRRAARAGLDVAFETYDGRALPYPDASFDHVVSSLVAHHLAHKVATFREALRVLRPGGLLSLVDYGPPRGAYARLAEALTNLTDDIGDNRAGRIPPMLEEAGFAGVGEVGHYTILSGTISLLHARRA